MDISTFLVMLHVIGTILGTGGATVAELQIARALKDKRLSMDERALMHANYGMIRVGMAIIAVSVLGMFWYFSAQGSDALWTDDRLLIKELMFAVIFINAVALHKRWVPLWLGASLSFTSWWGATLLGLAGELPFGFVTYLIGYIIAVFAIAGLFHLLRLLSALGILTGRTTIIAMAIVLGVVMAIIYYLIQGEFVAKEMARESVESEPVADYRSLTETVSFDYPGGTHTILFEFAVNDAGVIQQVEAADVDPENQGRIADFVELVNEEVVGQSLQELPPLSKVGSASLTTAAFNEAVERLQS